MLDDVDLAVDKIVERLGSNIVIGLPLGLGKPVEFVNAFYRRAKQDPTLRLRILTALSLEKPVAGNRIERAFLAPLVKRVFEGVPELDYMIDRRQSAIPPNVEVCEFYFRPGSCLNDPVAQQRYISSNYSHVARDVFNQGCNVVAQMIGKRANNGVVGYSMSCNPDTSPELVDMLRQSGRPHVAVGVVNPNLPFMFNDAEAGPDEFDIIVDHDRYHTPLFSTPKLAVTTSDYMIGLQASTLIKDGGTLQVGIGALGDAIIHSTILRHRQNDRYQNVLRETGILDRTGSLIDHIGGISSFDIGLYGCTEMFVDGYLHLQNAGILKRRVYDFWALQRLVNDGSCDPDHLDAGVLEALEGLGVRTIRGSDFDILQHHGVFSEGTRYDRGYIVAPDGARAVANLADPVSREIISSQCLGTRLRNGIVLHGGFFLGPRAFYEALRSMPEAHLRGICMTGVFKVNQLDHNPRLYKEQRINARFINCGLVATLGGAICSDGLEDGRVVSGVGGQYNFVAMAHQLLHGRSILMIRAVRDKPGKSRSVSSNIVFNYGNITIPRHLRDIVVTEYGIADLRSKTDAEVVKGLLNIADSRFQDELLAAATRAGKLEADYRIPEQFRRNLPEIIEDRLAAFRREGLLPSFPFGTDLTDDEVRLGGILKRVNARVQTTPRWRLLLDSMRPGGRGVSPETQRYLDWLGLVSPKNLQEQVLRTLIAQECLAQDTH